MADNYITEEKFEKYIDITNEKLDVLIELTRQMAVVQERQQHTFENIVRLEKTIGDTKLYTKSEIDSLDKKISLVFMDKKDESQKHLKKIEDQFASHDEKLKSFHSDYSELKEDYKGNKQFLRGAVWICGVIFVVVQGLGFKYISAINYESEQNKARFEQLNEKLSKLNHLKPQQIDNEFGSN